MKLPLTVEPKLLNPGISNADNPHCFAQTYFQGQLIIAYGSSNRVIILTSTLSVISSLERHNPDSQVTAISWAPYSGRLTSAATDNKIIIWEPNTDENGDSTEWHYSKELTFEGTPITCLSWSMCDHIFCTCNDRFTIYHAKAHQSINDGNSNTDNDSFQITKAYVKNLPTKFVSHSRDSRFILIIPKKSKEVILFHRREKTSQDYCEIHLAHPSIVTAARWRTADQIHERCFFMTTCKDNILRIWSETCVNEQMFFNVVVVIPAKYHIIAANFISTTSRLVANNPIINKNRQSNQDNKNGIIDNFFQPKLHADTYAYGHGHFPLVDRNIRDINYADKEELDRNHFWLLTLNKDQELLIWELSEMSSDVRRSPKIVKYTNPIPLGISSSLVNQIYGYCRLESEYSHLNDSNFVGRPSTLSLIIQNRKTKVITAVEASIIQQGSGKGKKTIIPNNVFNTNGHEKVIKTIHCNQGKHFMATLDEGGTVIIWKYNDTDVYDPCNLTQFYCQLGIEKMEAISWMARENVLIGFNGKKLLKIKIPRIPRPNTVEKVREYYLKYTPARTTTYLTEGRRTRELTNHNTTLEEDIDADTLFELRYAIQLSDGSYIIFTASRTTINIMRLDDLLIQNMMRIQCTSLDSLPEDDELQNSEETTTKDDESTQEDESTTQDNESSSIKKKVNIQPTEEFVDCTSVFLARLLPYAGATICFFATKHVVYCAILQETELTKDNLEKAILLQKCYECPDEKIRSICVAHPGYLFVACQKRIHICLRSSASSHFFTLLHYIDTPDYVPIKIGSLPSGFFSVLSKEGIHLYYPIRKSYTYLSSNIKWIKVASYHTKKSISSSSMAWTLDGILVFSMENQLFAFTKYMDSFFLKSDINQKFPTIHHSLSHIADMIPDFHPSILIPIAISGRATLLMKMLAYLNKNYDNPVARGCYADLVLHLNKKQFLNDFSFDDNSIKIINELKEKITNSPIPEFSDSDNKIFLNFLDGLPNLLQLPPEFVDSRAMPAARAIALNPTSCIPFDLINLVHMSEDQKILFDKIDFTNWESIKNSGVLLWAKSISTLAQHLVKFAISCFTEKQNISIIILVTLQRFLVLKTLFSKSGDDTRAQFFVRDFKDHKAQRSAEKNGYSALSKQNYHIAAAMFLLANQLQQSLRIILHDLKDIGLAYFVCRCQDLKKGNNEIGKDNSSDENGQENQITKQFIENTAIPLAKEMKDYAAVDFFNRILNPEMNSNLDERYESPIAGNMYPSSNYFGDMRFVTIEVLRTTLEQKANLSLNMLLSGHCLLSSLFIDYFNLSKNSPTSINSPSSFDFFGSMRRSRSISDNADTLSRANSDQVNDSVLYMKQVEKSLSDEEESESDRKNDFVDFSFGFTEMGSLSDEYTTSSDEESNENNNAKTTTTNNSVSTSNFKAALLSPTINELQTRPRIPLPLNAHKNQVNIDISKTKTAITNPSQLSFQMMTSSASITNLVSSHASYNLGLGSDLNWFVLLIGFNIARIRLESYLETQDDFKCIDQSISRLIPEISLSEEQLELKRHQLLFYLIRSCKGKGFVFRRLLLLSQQEEKKYISDLCLYLSYIPDQMMGGHFTSQQVAQIAMTLKCLIRFIVQVDPFKDEADINLKKFIFGSILTALYIIAIFYHDISLIKKVLNAKYPDLSPFVDSIDARSIPTREDFHSKYTDIQHEWNDFSFVTHEKAKTFFSFLPENDQEVSITFITALIDFLLIDSFYRKILNLIKDERNSHTLYSLRLSIKKILDAQVQYFSYATLNFQDYAQFSSLTQLTNDAAETELGQLIEQQLDLYKRRKSIPLFCAALITKFRYKHSKTMKNIRTGMVLKRIRPINQLAVHAYSVCVTNKGTKLFYITKRGLESLSLDNLQQDESSKSSKKALTTNLFKKVSDNNLTLFPNDDVETAEQIPVINLEEQELSEQVSSSEKEQSQRKNSSDDDSSSSSSSSISTSVTSSSSSSEQDRAATPTIPQPITRKVNSIEVCMERHPTRELLLVGDINGGVYVRKTDNDNEIYSLATGRMTKCNGVAFSADGFMIAAAFDDVVLLWSSLVHSNTPQPDENDRFYSMQKEPFTVIQTYSRQVVGVQFIKGTGIIATIQIESKTCRANIAFWDVFMPNQMFASLTLKEEDGIVTCMKYSPLFGFLFVGTDNGRIFEIDTKTFQIINSWKIYNNHTTTTEHHHHHHHHHAHTDIDNNIDNNTNTTPEVKEEEKREGETKNDEINAESGKIMRKSMFVSEKKHKDKKHKKHKKDDALAPQQSSTTGSPEKEKVEEKKHHKEKSCSVNAIVIDHEQSFIATGSSTGFLKIWNIQTSKLLLEKQIFDKSKKEITGIDFYKNMFYISGGDNIEIYHYTLHHHHHKDD